MHRNSENAPNREFSFAYESLVKVRELLDSAIEDTASKLEAITHAKTLVESILELVVASPSRRFLVRWAPLIYVVLIGIAEGVFVELYCLWHGACFICWPNPLRLYDPANIQKLAGIDFVAKINGTPTVMAFTAEVLMWSSLGVWAHRVHGMVFRYERKEINLPVNIATYIGILARNTSVAAIVLIILKLAKFSVFDVKLDDFDVVVGLSFMLGFFGNDAVLMLIRLRNYILKALPKKAAEEIGDEKEDL